MASSLAQLLVVLQPLLHLRLLFGSDAELPCASSGIADRQHPDTVAFPSPTLRTTLAMKNLPVQQRDRKSTRLNSSHSQISYAVFCLKKKKYIHYIDPRHYRLAHTDPHY